MSFYLSWLDSSPRSDRYRAWLEGVRTQKLNTLLGIPEFDIEGLPWIGASYIATEFWGTMSEIFSIRKPQIDPSDFNFFLCVRTPQQNDDGLNVTRYKLWEPSESVRLETFPVYNQQRISGPFAIEVWTLPSSDEVNIEDVEYLISSIIIDPATCCCDANPVVMLAEHCDIWATKNINGNYTLPIQFNTCFNAILPQDTFYRITETNDIRATETDDRRVYV